MPFATQIVLSGTLFRETLPDWVEHRALKLGLSGWVKWDAAGQLEITVIGHDDLIDALEIACSLGPYDSRIEATRREKTNISSLSIMNTTFQNLCSDA